MPKYIVSQSIPCWVTWSYEIEAETEEDARNQYLDGDLGKALGYKIGNNIEFIPDEIEVKKTR